MWQVPETTQRRSWAFIFQPTSMPLERGLFSVRLGSWHRQLAGLVVAIAASATMAEAAPPGSDDWVPDAPTIAHLEGALQLPRGAYPLVKYDRYYSGFYKDGRKFLSGVYIFHRPETDETDAILPSQRHPASIHIVGLSKQPRVADGGCSVINVRYDVLSAVNSADVWCNGVA